MGPNKFTYESLAHAAGVFRLLKLKKGTGRALEGELIHTTLNEEKDQYEAVSYTWGAYEKADYISINGKELDLHLNLSLILRDLRSAEEDRILWIDAICINQGDINERGHQVQSMRAVYQNASRVLFCISRPNEFTDVVMASLEALQSQLTNQEWNIDSDLFNTAWNVVQAKLGGEYSAYKQRQKAGLEHILTQPWFSRVWILQEVANARDAMVYCGKICVSASIFATSPCLISVNQPESQRYQPVLDLMPGSTRQYTETHQDRDLLSLLKMFPSAQASEEYDRIYALLSLCTDEKNHPIFATDYNKTIKEVLCDTISHIFQCDIRSDSGIPYESISSFLKGVENLDNEMLLHCLSVSDVLNTVFILNNRGENITVSDEMLEWAASNAMQKNGVMNMLLQRRDNNTHTLLPNTLLHWAAENGYDSTARLLLQHGADIHAKDRYGRTSLLLAANKGHESTALLLLQHGADIHAKDRDGRTSLLLAANQGHESTALLLLQYGADIHAKDRFNCTSLLLAARYGVISHSEEGLTLPARGVQYDRVRTTTGKEAFRFGFPGKKRDIVRLLLDRGADIQARAAGHKTALHIASEFADEDMFRFLLENGADVDAKDIWGRTPLQCGILSGHETDDEIVRVLRERGVAIDDINFTSTHASTNIVHIVE